MSHENEIGLFLADEAERQILGAAALSCGLQFVDLHTLTSGISPADIPSIIVTDQPTGPWNTGHPSSFSQYDAPMLLEVRDPVPFANLSSDDAPGAGFIIHRPLRLESATAVLKQAASMTHFFIERHRSMFEDLNYCRRIFESVSNGITISDANVPGLPLTYVNPAFERMTGYSASEVCGRSCNFLQGSETNQPAVAAIRKALSEATDLRIVLRNFRKDGILFWNELNLSPIRDLSGKLTHFVGIQNDVTLQIEATQQLQYLAQHDALTGLANRAMLMAQLQQSLLRAQRVGGTIAVLYFDLDNFKFVNDTFGHDAGDRLLLVVADRLRSQARSGETVARLGGDEFVVVLEQISDDRTPSQVMKRLIAKLGETTDVVGTGFHPSASVGMSLYPEDGHTADEMLKSADLKMYIAKHAAHAGDQAAEEQRLNEQVQTPSARSPALHIYHSRA